MGNLVQIDRFHSDELSEQANCFINNHRPNWNNFILQVQVAVRNKDQDKLDTAISKLVPCFEEEEDPKALWEELWSWVVKNNKKKWKKQENV